MFNDRFNSKEGIVPILLSMFLGLLVVLLLGGFILNLIGNFRNSRGARVDTARVETQATQKAAPRIIAQPAKPAKEAYEKAPKEGLLSKLKKYFSTRKENKKSADVNKPAKIVTAQKLPEKPKGSMLNPVSAVQTSTFLRAVGMSGLTELSAEKGEVFTIFMPSNQAFENSRMSLDNLINKGDQKALQLFTKRHITRGKVRGGTVYTLSGDRIIVDFTKNTVSFNGNIAHIIETRGDTFIIDRVLY